MNTGIPRKTTWTCFLCDQQWPPQTTDDRIRIEINAYRIHPGVYCRQDKFPNDAKPPKHEEVVWSPLLS